MSLFQEEETTTNDVRGFSDVNFTFIDGDSDEEVIFIEERGRTITSIEHKDQVLDDYQSFDGISREKMKDPIDYLALGSEGFKNSDALRVESDVDDQGALVPKSMHKERVGSIAVGNQIDDSRSSSAGVALIKTPRMSEPVKGTLNKAHARANAIKCFLAFYIILLTYMGSSGSWQKMKTSPWKAKKQIHVMFDFEEIIGNNRGWDDFGNLLTREGIRIKEEINRLVTKVDKNMDRCIDQNELRGWVVDAFREVSQDSTSQLLDLNNRNSISLGGRYRGFKEEWLNFLKQLKTHISMSFKFDGWYEQTLGWIWIHEDEVVDNEVVYLMEICDDDKNGLLSLDEIEKHYKILLQLEDTNYGVFLAYNAMKKRFDEES